MLNKTVSHVTTDNIVGVIYRGVGRGDKSGARGRAGPPPGGLHDDGRRRAPLRERHRQREYAHR